MVKRSLKVWLLAFCIGSCARLEAQSYYLDCQAGSDDASGLSPASAWRTLGKVNEGTYSAGSQILLRRQTLCGGTLAPKGSGTEGHPISIGAYGTGALPQIDGRGRTESVSLFNQQYWEISNLDLLNSSVYGIHVSGNAGVLHHIYLRDLQAHDIKGDLNSKDSGGVVISTGAPEQTFEDVLIDGVRAYDVTQWSGIFVNALNSGYGENAPKNHHVHITNSSVHNIFGDGIIIYGAEDAIIENSVAYQTGVQPVQTIGTPNAIWTFECTHCVVQFNEGYQSTSPGVDGGVFDIDYYSIDTTVQYNYAHDADGYCVGLFGAEGQVTRQSVVRYNVCINNARKAAIAFQGDLYLVSWNGGSFDGVDIHNNTVIWNPVQNHPVLVDFGQYKSPAFFRNNLIYSSVTDMINASALIRLDHNLYWTAATKSPLWTYANKSFTSLSSFQSATGQDARSVFADPKFMASHPKAPSDIQLRAESPAVDAGATFSTLGDRDYFGIPVPQGNGPDIGASERPNHAGLVLSPPEVRADGARFCAGKTALVTYFDGSQSGDREAARSTAVVLRSAANQYSANGICTLLIDASAHPQWEEYFANLRADWDLGPVQLISRRSHPSLSGTYLLRADGFLLANWRARPTAVEIGPLLYSLNLAPFSTP